MTEPRLTVVIPTHDRPVLLRQAIYSCLNQTVQAKIIVSDNADAAVTAGVLRDHFSDHLVAGQITHITNPPRGAWQNWMAGALVAETPLVSWLQDDDIVSKRYVERICHAFSEAERLGVKPSVWMARLDACDASGRFGLHYAHNGPIVPMFTLYGEEEPIHYRDGAFLAASSYFTSHSLSPALAYRNGDHFRSVLQGIPDTCDIFIERIMPAAMAREGGVIADPVVVGYWRQHDTNLSRQQWVDQPRQTKLLVPYLDDLLDSTPAWEEKFSGWCGAVSPALLIVWLGQIDTTEREGGKSRHGRAIRKLMLQSLSGRVKYVPGPWKARLSNWAKNVARNLIFRKPRAATERPVSAMS